MKILNFKNYQEKISELSIFLVLILMLCNVSLNAQTVPRTNSVAPCSGCTPLGWTSTNGGTDVSTAAGWSGSSAHPWEDNVLNPPNGHIVWISASVQEYVDVDLSDLIEGEMYSLDFSMAELRSAAAGGGTVDNNYDGILSISNPFVSGSPIYGNFQFTGGSSNDWSQQTLTFTATGTTMKLRFKYLIFPPTNGNFWNVSLSADALTLLEQNDPIEPTCNNPVAPDATGITFPNGITVTSDFNTAGTGLTTTCIDGTTSFITPDNSPDPKSVWIGGNGSLSGDPSITYTFSEPVNDIVFFINGTDVGENFTFTPSSGDITITHNSCNFAINATNENMIYLTAAGGSPGTISQGGYFQATSSTPYTTMKVEASTAGAGSYISICGGSIEGYVADSDGDGIADADDNCPNSGTAGSVDAQGCPDTDGDAFVGLADPDGSDACNPDPNDAACNNCSAGSTAPQFGNGN